MTPLFFRKLIFNSKLHREQCIQNKKKYAVVKYRKLYSMPNGPEDPDYIMLFITALSSYFAIKFCYRK